MACLHWLRLRPRPIKNGLKRILWRCSYCKETETDANFHWVAVHILSASVLISASESGRVKEPLHFKCGFTCRPTRKCSTLGSHIRRQHIPEKLSMHLFILEDLPRGWRHSHSKDKRSTSYYLSCCRTVSLPCPSVVSGELHSSLSEVPLHFLLPLLHQMLLATPLEVHFPNLLCVFHE